MKLYFFLVFLSICFQILTCWLIKSPSTSHYSKTKDSNVHPVGRSFTALLQVHTEEENEQADAVGTNSEKLTSSDIHSSIDEVWTSAVLNVSYDGSRFTGWSSTSSTKNDHQNSMGKKNNSNNDVSKDSNAIKRPPLRLSAQKRRRQKKERRLVGFVRGVEGVLQKNLARLYGDVDVNRMQVEGCSRTDKGVHATSMIVQFYCLNTNTYESIVASRQNKNETNTTTNNNATVPITLSIPGKRIPHPQNRTDSTHFDRIPFPIEKIQFCLNRMLPDDIRITNISPPPIKKPRKKGGTVETSDMLPFHPTLDTVSKTYQYTFSIGQIHDPSKWRFVWHIDDDIDNFDLDKLQQACAVLTGTHDFIAFRGAPRGSDDKRRQQIQNTTCTISRLRISYVEDDHGFSDASTISSADAGEKSLATSTYTITVTGDRFLYKMVRFLVGALVSVGCGKIELEDIQQALNNGSWKKESSAAADTTDKDKRVQFVCAPPHGLILRGVSYGDHIQLDWIL